MEQVLSAWEVLQNTTKSSAKAAPSLPSGACVFLAWGLFLPPPDPVRGQSPLTYQPLPKPAQVVMTGFQSPLTNGLIPVTLPLCLDYPQLQKSMGEPVEGDRASCQCAAGTARPTLRRTRWAKTQCWPWGSRSLQQADPREPATYHKPSGFVRGTEHSLHPGWWPFKAGPTGPRPQRVDTRNINQDCPCPRAASSEQS